MVTMVQTSQMTDVLLDPGSPSANVGTGNAQASEVDINLQGTNCAATGHSGSVGPTSPTSINQFRGMYSTVTGFTRTDTHISFWVRDLYPVRNKSVGGVSAYIFGSSEAIYYFTGIDEGYLGSWVHIVLNLDPTDRPAASLGTAPSSNITRIGYAGNISVTKGESFINNCYLDAMRRGAGGQGITIVGGSTSARGTYADCASADNDSFGIFRIENGTLKCEGPIIFGAAASTTFIEDQLKTIKFTNYTVASGSAAVSRDYYRIVYAAGTTGITSQTSSDITWEGASKEIPFGYDTSALASTDVHSPPRSTYVFGKRIKFGVNSSSISDRFVECSTIEPNGISLNSPVFSNSDRVDLTSHVSSAFDGGSTALHNTSTTVPFVITDSLTKVSNHSFDNTGGTGYAIELVSTAVGSATISLVGNTFTGYGSSGTTNAAIHNAVASGILTINITGGGNTPTVTTVAGGSTIVNNAVSFTLTTLKSDSEVRIYSSSTNSELSGIESSGTTFTYNYNYTVDTSVYIVIFHLDWQPIRLPITLGSLNQSIPIQQIVDRVYLNPA